MAKAKQFNISNFMDDAAESVQVAEEQRKKEARVKVQETKQNYTPEEEQLVAIPVMNNQVAPQATIQNAVPVQNDRVGVSQSAPTEEPQKGKRGRKKSLRTIERVNGKIVFLEKSMDADLARLSTFERFDKQDIIRTALYQWLLQHSDGMMLDDSGRREVIEYIQRTTTFEDL